MLAVDFPPQNPIVGFPAYRIGERAGLADVTSGPLRPTLRAMFFTCHVVNVPGIDKDSSASSGIFKLWRMSKRVKLAINHTLNRLTCPDVQVLPMPALYLRDLPDCFGPSLVRDKWNHFWRGFAQENSCDGES